MEEKITINGVEIYGIISICIFFAFFTGMLVWAFAQKKTHLDKMSDLPLENGEKTSNENKPA